VTGAAGIKLCLLQVDDQPFRKIDFHHSFCLQSTGYMILCGHWGVRHDIMPALVESLSSCLICAQEKAALGNIMHALKIWCSKDILSPYSFLADLMLCTVRTSLLLYSVLNTLNIGKEFPLSLYVVGVR
jgi:hypothetical protein